MTLRLLLLAPLLLGCGPRPAPVSPTSPTRPADPTGLTTAEPGYQLLMLAASCWLGGVWGDIEGRPVATRPEAAHRLCRALVREVYGDDREDHYLQVRAVTDEAVAAVASKALALAQNPREERDRHELAALVRALGAAQSENMYARRAADRLQIDAEQERPKEKVARDEAAVVGALGAHEALAALLRLDAGRYSGDARALGLLSAMDRLELSRGLSTERKLYATEGALALVLGVPQVPVDPLRPLPPGRWLAYLTEAARVAGHPVSDSVVDPRQRDALAWGGVLAGFADRLREAAARLSPSATPVLSRAVDVVVRRLDGEYAVLKREAATRQSARAPR